MTMHRHIGVKYLPDSEFNQIPHRKYRIAM